MTDGRDALMTGRSSDGKPVRRPLSPHLLIYRWQITSMMSIFHRATGLALGVGTLLLVWWLIAAATSDDAYAIVAGVVHSPVGFLLMFGWTGSLWYHFCNGIRHLAWDFGYGFELPQVHASGYAALAAAGVLTVLTWIVVLATV
jgi:succinate dehydrogenase / fumarate reductase cytochrome b subunit